MALVRLERIREREKGLCEDSIIIPHSFAACNRELITDLLLHVLFTSEVPGKRTFLGPS